MAINVRKSGIAYAAAAFLLSQNSLVASTEVELAEITVTSASGYEQNIKDAPASITVISAEVLKNHTPMLRMS